MPPITRWMLKTSLVYFLLALVIGLLQAIAPWFSNRSLAGFFNALDPVRIHVLVIGWISLLIFGVAIWMFPKYSQQLPRGHLWLGWAAYGLLNGGLVLRIIGESANRPGTIFGWMLVAAALLLWLAGVAFVISAWPRIKEK